jgi:spore photoproduct lyase
LIVHTSPKTLVTRDNGRSADAIAPNFIYGCLGGCMSSYCYVGRYNADEVRVYDNPQAILSSVSKWVEKQPWPKTPNQTDAQYYTIDIGCSTDVALMGKYLDWQLVFDYFNQHPKAKSTFATKYPSRFRAYDLDPAKNRIRVSLMPQVYSDVLEPNTESIISRIESIPRLQERLEVHLNFSPIIYTEGWLKEYEKLFKLLAERGIDLPCECIFLTYNVIQEARNSQEVNRLCRRPEFQESKDSQYAPDNIRYKAHLKQQLVQIFKRLHQHYFTSQIRYIF